MDISHAFHGWLYQPSSYPTEYTNFLHGSLDYWYVPDTFNTFKPDLSEHPFVAHPHMHPDYVKTFLETPHVKESQTYMLPNYNNHKETISFQDHQTICSTDMTEGDCEDFVGVVFKNLPQKGQRKKRISEYVMFQSKMIGRIPYDSEIVHFLNNKLGLNPSSLKNSVGDIDYERFQTLVMRIHDSCTVGLFKIKLKGKM